LYLEINFIDFVSPSLLYVDHNLLTI